ncbi:hypothetical protein NLS1_02130 [Nocardioides sp. LS1]|nr:hypothetical protein NLS1_02130 [Nocardioides sp. LS1]
MRRRPVESAKRLSLHLAAAAALAGATIVTPLVMPPASAVQAESFSLVTVTADGSGPALGQFNLNPVTVSTDLRYVSFRSDSTTLVADDTNGQADLFVRDRVAGTTVRANITDTGAVDNGGSYMPRLSADGRHVAFLSYSAMVAADTNTNTNIFGSVDPNRNVDAYIRDLDTGVTEQVSVGPAGQQGNGSAGGGVDTSADGQLVVFGGDAGNWGVDASYGAIWLRDRQAGTTTLIKAGNPTIGSVGGARISDDGSVVAFIASTPQGRNALYAYDRTTSQLERIDVTTDGSPAAAYHLSSYDLSANGNVVAFSADDSLVANDVNGSNYDDAYVRDRAAGTTRLVSLNTAGAQDPSPVADITLSADGRFVGYTSWHNIGTPGWDAGTDVYVKDVRYGSLWHVGVDGYGVNAAAGGALGGSGLEIVVNAAGNSSPDLTGSQELYVASRTADTLAPTVYGSPRRGPDGAGWYSAPVTIDWSAYDPYPSWGPAATPAPTTASTEGVHTYTSGQSCDLAGNCATGDLELSLDLTKPTVAVNRPADGATFAIGAAVTADYSCDDALSGLSTCTGTGANGGSVDTSTVGQHTFSVTGTDAAGNERTTTTTYTVTGNAPSAPEGVSAAAGDATATVSWTVPTDTGGSAITSYTVTASPGGATRTVPSATTSTTMSGLANGTPYTFRVAATNGTGTGAQSPASNAVTPQAGSAAPLSVSAYVDPATGGRVTTDPGGTGPTPTSPLTASVTVPSGSTGDTVTIAQTTTTETAPAAYSFLGQQVNITAPVATAARPLVIAFRIDPSLMTGHTFADFTLSRAEGTTPSAVIADCTSPGAGIAAPDPCVVRSFATDGSGDLLLTAYTSHASRWNVAAHGDTTAPTVTVSSPVAGTAYVYGRSVPVTFSCADETGGSGLASCTGVIAAGGTTRSVPPSGGTVNTTLVGAQTLTVTATDVAGNQRRTTTAYTVVYPFAGFFSPVASTGTTAANAGSTAPMPFSLGGNRGLSVLASSSPVSYPVNCSTGARTGADVATTGTLSYDVSSGRYTYKWSTVKTWGGSCRTFVLGLKDGTSHPATFSFKK